MSQANEANIWIDKALLDLDEELQKLIKDIEQTEELIIDAKHKTIKSYILSPKELFNTLREHTSWHHTI